MEQLNKRAGDTITTSVSLSKEFRSYMDAYHISPTEAIKIGVSIALFEKGVPQFNNELNQKRIKFLEQYKQTIKTNEIIEKLRAGENILKEIAEQLEKIS